MGKSESRSQTRGSHLPPKIWSLSQFELLKLPGNDESNTENGVLFLFFKY